MARFPRRPFLIARRMLMNYLMGTRWYPPIRYRLRKRATTGTGDLTGEAYAAQVQTIFKTYQKHLAGRLEDFSGLRVLEIGPGEHLGVALLFVTAGARQVVCIDRFREVRNSAPEVQAMYAELRKTLNDAAARKRLDSAFASLNQCEDDRENPVVYLPNLPLEKSAPENLGLFDLIVSTSVLEHVTDLQGDMKIMRNLLSPGGWIAHCVDLSSHDRYESYPLEFLETEDSLWNPQFSNIGGPNRCRAGGYRRYMEEAGFRDIYLHVDLIFPKEAVDRAKGSKLSSRFGNLSDSDLSAWVIFICARKPLEGKG